MGTGRRADAPAEVVRDTPCSTGGKATAIRTTRATSARRSRASTAAAAVAVLLLVAVPTGAGAATVSVEPFVERLPPGDDGFGSCGRYAQCPADMVVFTAASGETNRVAITEAVVRLGQVRYLVRDTGASVVAGPGCERVDEDALPPIPAAAICTAAAIGPQRLGDGDDWISSPGGWASGGGGDDVLFAFRGDGGSGDDVLFAADWGEGGGGHDLVIGQRGAGGRGDDRLMLGSGLGDSGNDTLSCLPRGSACSLTGGAGDDVLTGGTGNDRLIGRWRRRRHARRRRWCRHAGGPRGPVGRREDEAGPRRLRRGAPRPGDRRPARPGQALRASEGTAIAQAPSPSPARSAPHRGFSVRVECSSEPMGRPPAATRLATRAACGFEGLPVAVEPAHPNRRPGRTSRSAAWAANISMQRAPSPASRPRTRIGVR